MYTIEIIDKRMIGSAFNSSFERVEVVEKYEDVKDYWVHQTDAAASMRIHEKDGTIIIVGLANRTARITSD